MRDIAVIGAGHWGKNLIRVFHEMGRLGVVCDESTVQLNRVSEQNLEGVRLAPFARQVWEDKSIKGVVIATPASTHFDLAHNALMMGKDVFVEKPMALHEMQGRMLVATAEEKGRVLLVGHVLEYHPAVVRLCHMVSAGELGALLYIYSNRLNLGRFRTEENVMWSFAPHDIAVMLSLTDAMPVKVVAHAAEYLTEGVADMTMTALEFPDNVHGHIFVSWLHPFKEQRLVVVGSEAMAVFDDQAAEKLVVYQHQVEWDGNTPTPAPGERKAIAISAVEPLLEECRDFVNCMESRHTPMVDGRKGAQVLKVLEMCQQALKEERP